MKTAGRTAIYALGHFLIDFLCAWGMFRFCRQWDGWMTAVLLYNFCAFALQMPLGLVADRLGAERSFAVLGCALTLGACLLLREAPPAFAVAAGLGNALYHVGGGVAVLHAYPKRAGPLGLFVSPGAFGIYFGTLAGKSASLPLYPALAVTGLCALAILFLCKGEKAPALDVDARGAGTAAILCLFLVVCLRSWLGFLFTFPWKTGTWALLAVCGVVLGKTAGGYVSDRFGAKWASAASLGLAAVLFLLSSNPICGTLAIFLFNMSMPITLRGAADALPGMPGFSFGLLTFALFLGFLPTWLGIPAPGTGWFLSLGAAVSLGLLLPGLRKNG
jgi:FSR family fosmidomycin resistance protein-like MFS transporter